MKQGPFLTLLVATTLATAGAVWFSVTPRPDESSAPANLSSALPQAARNPDGVGGVTIETIAYRLDASRSKAGWVAHNHDDYSIRPAAISTLIGSIAALRPVEPKTSNPQSYPAIGVANDRADDQTIKLTFSMTDGSAGGGLIVGKRSAALSYDPLGGVFVRQPTERQSWLAQGYAAYPREFSEWFDEIPNFPATKVMRVRISQDGKIAFDATKDRDFYHATKSADETPPESKDINDAAVKRMAASLVSGAFDDVRSVGKGGSAAEVRTVRFDLSDGLSIITLISADGWVRFSAESTNRDASATAADLNQRFAGWAYRIPVRRVNALLTTVQDLTTPSAGGPEGLGFPAGPGATFPPASRAPPP